MISWKVVAVDLVTQVLIQVVLFFGIPLLGPPALLDWSALLTWSAGSFLGGAVAGFVRDGSAWISGLLAGLLGSTLFVVAVLFRGDWWLVAMAILGGGLFVVGGALVGRGITRPVSSR